MIFQELGQQLSTVPNAYKSAWQGSFVHELGHHYTVFHKDTLQRASDYLGITPKQVITTNISTYAATQPSELVAECYALFHHPQFNELIPGVQETVRNILGK